tara:strand:+ start:2756 stop:3514 length:759 start_codon:yes stop_codon:yes gene_type:complete
MANTEKTLQEELKRFNQIGYNATNLEEQMLGSVGGGSGFMSKQGDSIRLKNFNERQQEMSEQEENPEDAAPDITTFDEMGVGDDTEAELDIETTPPTDIPPAAPTDTPPVAPPIPPAAPVADGESEEGATEVEVTDLVDKQENLEKNTEETNNKLESLMSMLDGMEEKLSGMDQLMNQISSLEQKIEKYRPKTEEEKIEMRKLDSGPYNQSLANFWDDSQEKFETQGKTEYVLNTDDVQNFSDTEIQQSFNG